jgi:pantoate kinase
LNTRIDIEEMIRELSKDPSVWQRLDINAKIMLLYSLSQRQIKELKERLENFIRYLMMNDREMLVLMVVMMNKEKRLEFATAFKEIVRELIKDIGKYIMPRD